MDDQEIVGLYWRRSETAIRETAGKYERYLTYIAFNILADREDSEECVSETYLRAWNSMPPRRPSVLRTFLGRITRNLSLDRWDHLNARKRGAGQVTLALEELRDALPQSPLPEDNEALKETIDGFLAGLSGQARVIFVRRYWYLCPIREIAQGLNVSESKVKMTLLRARQGLRKALEKEEIHL